MPEFSTAAESQVATTPNHVRHFQWNDDYIELLSHRLELASVKTLVELGSGLGYLAGLFGLYMKPGSQVLGFEPSAEMVAEAEREAAERPYSVAHRFAQAELHRLPLADGLADLAISHHVLPNVPDAAAVVAEMTRVVRPGGRVVAFEPNHSVQSLVLDADTRRYAPEDRLKLVRYQLYYEAGKRALGLGDDAVGDDLPRLFQAAGLQQIEVRISDKAAALVPPYDTEEKQARIQELRDWLAEFQQNTERIRACFLAGGGSEAEWADYHDWEHAQSDRIAAGIQAGTYWHPGGMLTYIVIGTKA
ncbi:MAG: methyltransferase domain-containing protein [Candidatus Sericytochromatia bacterium]|nr:methyltransferase domain-containing protein [Candidatus Sericytochromatia bacterium]